MVHGLFFQIRRLSPRIWIAPLLMACLIAGARDARAAADPVLEWMKITNDSVLAAGTSPLVTSRHVALVSASVFDAVNGIARRYEPLHVTDRGPRPASERAAAIQAAYATLIKLFPSMTAGLTTRRDASVAALSTGPDAESPARIQAGMTWGQTVADAIWAWHQTDGFQPDPAPGFLGSLGRPVAGVWRPTPRADGSAGATGASPQFATLTPWVMLRASQFRPSAPYAGANGQIDLTNAQYLADYHETKMMGVLSGSPRSADQSDLALFWAGNTALYWNRIASQVSQERGLSMLENAHLFALLDVSMADAAIACWDAKYRFVLWRPITAIREGTVDPDATWRPWLDSLNGTPAHPEFPSGHSTVSGAAAHVLASIFGDDTPFTIDTEVAAATLKIRPFASFSDALAEIHNARVFGGIHWRTACRVGSAVGAQVADYVASHTMRPRDEGNNF